MPKNKNPIATPKANALLSDQNPLFESKTTFPIFSKKTQKKSSEKTTLEMIFKSRKKEPSLEDSLVFTKEKKEILKKKPLLKKQKKSVPKTKVVEQKKEEIKPKVASPFVKNPEEKVPQKASPVQKTNVYLIENATAKTMKTFRFLAKNETKPTSLPQATRLSRKIRTARDIQENTILEIDAHADHLRLYRPEKKQCWRPKGTKSAPEEAVSQLLRISPYKSLRSNIIPTEEKRKEERHAFSGVKTPLCHFRPNIPTEVDACQIHRFSSAEKYIATSAVGKENIFPEYSSETALSRSEMAIIPIFSVTKISNEQKAERREKHGEKVEDIPFRRESVSKITKGEKILPLKQESTHISKKKAGKRSFPEKLSYSSRGVLREIEKEERLQEWNKSKKGSPSYRLLQKAIGKIVRNFSKGTDISHTLILAVRKTPEEIIPEEITTIEIPKGSLILAVRKKPSLFARIQHSVQGIRTAKKVKELPSETLILAVRKTPGEIIPEEITAIEIPKGSLILAVRKKPSLFARIQHSVQGIRTAKKVKELPSETLILAVRKTPGEIIPEEITTIEIPKGSLILAVRKKPSLFARIQHSVQGIRTAKKVKELPSETLILAVRKTPGEIIPEEITTIEIPKGSLILAVRKKPSLFARIQHSVQGIRTAKKVKELPSETLILAVRKTPSEDPSQQISEESIIPEASSSEISETEQSTGIFSFFGNIRSLFGIKTHIPFQNIPALRALVPQKQTHFLPAIIPNLSRSIVSLLPAPSTKPTAELKEYSENTVPDEHLLSETGENSIKTNIPEKDNQEYRENETDPVTQETLVEEKASAFFEKWKGLFHSSRKQTQQETTENNSSAFDELFSPQNEHEEVVSPAQFPENTEEEVVFSFPSLQNPKGQNTLDEGISFLPLPPEATSLSEEEISFTDSVAEKIQEEIEQHSLGTKHEDHFESLKKENLFQKWFSKATDKYTSLKGVPSAFDTIFSSPSSETNEIAPEENVFSELFSHPLVSETQESEPLLETTPTHLEIPSEESFSQKETPPTVESSLPQETQEESSHQLAFAEEKEISLPQEASLEMEEKKNPFLEALPGLSNTDETKEETEEIAPIPEESTEEGEGSHLTKMLGNISKQKEEEVQVLGNEFTEELRQKNEKKQEEKRLRRKESLLALSRFVCAFSLIAPLCVWVYHEARLNPDSGLSETIHSENFGSQLVSIQKQAEDKKIQADTLQQKITQKETDISKIRNNQYLVDITKNRVDFIAVMLRIKDITFDTLKIDEELNKELKYLVFSSYSGSTSNGRTSITITGSVRDAKGMSWTQLTRLMEAINNDEYFDGAVIRNFSKTDDDYGGAVSQFSFNLTYTPPTDHASAP